MPPNVSPLAHKDIEECLNRALANGRGIRVFCGDYGTANALRQKAYTLRKLDRSENRKIYDPDHPSYNRSPYDALVLTPRQAADGEWFLYIEVSSPEKLQHVIEDLDENGLPI